MLRPPVLAAFFMCAEHGRGRLRAWLKGTRPEAPTLLLARVDEAIDEYAVGWTARFGRGTEEPPQCWLDWSAFRGSGMYGSGGGWRSSTLTRADVSRTEIRQRSGPLT